MLTPRRLVAVYVVVEIRVFGSRCSLQVCSWFRESLKRATEVAAVLVLWTPAPQLTRSRTERQIRYPPR